MSKYLQLEQTRTETTTWTVVVAIPDGMSEEAAMTALHAADVTENNLTYLFQADVCDPSSYESSDENDCELFDTIDDTDAYGPTFEIASDGTVKECAETTNE